MVYLLMGSNYRANVSEFHYSGQKIVYKIRLYQKINDIESVGSFERIMIDNKSLIESILNRKSNNISAYDCICKGLLEYYKEKEERIGTIEVENE